MEGLSEREKAFEAEFKHNQDLAFRIRARRNYFFGFWTVSLQHLEGVAADSYANSVVAAALRTPAEDDLIDKVKNDLTENGVPFSDEELRDKLKCNEVEARRQIGGSNI